MTKEVFVPPEGETVLRDKYTRDKRPGIVYTATTAKDGFVRYYPAGSDMCEHAHSAGMTPSDGGFRIIQSDVARKVSENLPAESHGFSLPPETDSAMLLANYLHDPEGEQGDPRLHSAMLRHGS